MSAFTDARIERLERENAELKDALTQVRAEHTKTRQQLRDVMQLIGAHQTEATS